MLKDFENMNLWFEKLEVNYLFIFDINFIER